MTLLGKVINHIFWCVGDENNEIDLLHPAFTTNTREVEKYLSIRRAHADGQMLLELNVLCFIGSQDN